MSHVNWLCHNVKITGLYRRISSLLSGSFAKETYHLKEPTSRSRSIFPRHTQSRLFFTRAVWIGHVPHELVMSHMKVSYHIKETTQHTKETSLYICMRHVTCELVMSPMSASYHTCLWVRRFRRFRFVHMDESFYIYINQSCHMCLKVLLREHGSYFAHLSITSRMKESCHVWMRHVTCERVTSHMKESCHIWMCHVTYVCRFYCVNDEVMSRMLEWSHVSHESCHVWIRHVTYVCGFSGFAGSGSFVWMSHVTYIWMRHVTYSCSFYCGNEQVMSRMLESRHIWRSRVTYECVMSHMSAGSTAWTRESYDIWMSHVTCKWVMSHMNVMSHVNESWHMWMNHVTYEFES